MTEAAWEKGDDFVCWHLRKGDRESEGEKI